MPRASGSSKRQSGNAGNRDSRHDNGLVGPAKRISNKKSQNQLVGEGPVRPSDHPSVISASQNGTYNDGQINGNGRQPSAVAGPGRYLGSGQTGSSSSPSPVPSSSSLPFHTQLHTQPENEHHTLGRHQHALANGHKSPQSDALNGASHRASGDATRRSSIAGYSETSSSDSYSTSTHGMIESGHRQIDVNAMKNVDVHRDSGPFELAASVLKSLPMQDTLAILIILMHVPSLSLSVIYTIFTFLTFVPPVTTSSGMNINLAEIFDGNSTMPSMFTVVCIDLVFLLIWLFFWPSLQDFILDCAKPVIAITLGGGSNGRAGSSRGIMTCFLFVLATHLLRGTKSQWSRLMQFIPEEWEIPSFLRDTLNTSTASFDKKTTYGLVRSVLAIHILTQGVVRYTVEWFLRREGAGATPVRANMHDPEVGKPQSVTGDSSHDSGGYNPSENEIGLHAAPQGGLGSKKRRKQSTQVRLQQPLWAALASTKIVVMKEYELSHAASESAGSNAVDLHDLGSAPFDRQPGQVWISFIGCDEVCFSTSYFPDHDDESPKVNGSSSRTAGIDSSKPFYIRVNHAVWQPARIFPVQEADEEKSIQGTRWTGDIYGLRPLSKYVCEFVDTRTDEVIFTTNVHTINQLKRENDGSAVTQEQSSLRPDSPTTTLRTSIAAAETKLNDEKNRLKTLRKDWKTKTNTLKRENESADNQLSTAGNQDEKHKQKIRQQETQKSQAERDTVSLGEQLKNFDTAPELMDRKKKGEKSQGAERKIFDAAQKQFKEFKSKLENEVSAKEIEKSNLGTRRNKIANRISKVETEICNISDANNRGIDEVERRKQARATWMDQANMIETNMSERLNRSMSDNLTLQGAVNVLHTELHSFQEIINVNGVAYDTAAASSDGMLHQFPKSNATWNPNPAAQPHFPQGMWSASSGDLRPASTSPWQPGPTAAPFEPRGSSSRTRGRTSSMLSDVSGFTQVSEGDEEFTGNQEQQTASPSRPRIRTSSISGSGSGSGSGTGTGTGSGSSSGSGSVGDPTSPT